MKEFAEVLVSHKAYTYSVPEHLQSQINIGQEVKLQFRNKTSAGFVVRFVESPKFPTKPILDIISTQENFDAKLIDLVDWIADYYKCYPETALKLILPKE